MAALLEELGHKAESVTDPRLVPGTVRRRRPDVVLLDIGMPHIDGFEVARQLKSEFPRLCVVAVTGHASDEHRRRGVEAGFEAYLAKPVNVTVLERILATIFASRKAS